MITLILTFLAIGCLADPARLLSIANKNPCLSKTCPDNKICIPKLNRKGKLRGKCIRKKRGRSCARVTCLEGEICKKGECIDLCTTITCPEESVGCVNGECVFSTEPLCGTSICTATETCVNDVCKPACSTPFQSCPPVTTCVDGVCIGLCDSVTCPPGQVCSNGVCIGSCAAVTCAPDTTCVDGKCVTLCNGVACGLLQDCDNGQCVNNAENPCNLVRCLAPDTLLSPGSSTNGCVVELDSDFIPTANCCGSTREVFNDCGSGCGEPTCADILNPNPFPVICPAVCINGCFCKDGYTRSVQNGECIPTFECAN